MRKMVQQTKGQFRTPAAVVAVGAAAASIDRVAGADTRPGWVTPDSDLVGADCAAAARSVAAMSIPATSAARPEPTEGCGKYWLSD